MKESTANPAPLIWTQPQPPARQRALGRSEIVAAAIALADDEGWSALTMKAVAAKLGPCSPMALYRYIYSKDGLIDLMLDEATAEIPIPDLNGSDWRADLRALAMDTRAMIKRHPWYVVLIHTRPPVGPHLMRRLEWMLAVLTNVGATLPAAMTYAALIDRHILGSGLDDAEEARMNARHGLDDPAQLRAALNATLALAEQGGHPLLAGWLADPSGPSPDEQFELGLGFLFDGIAARLPVPTGQQDPASR